MVGAVVIFAGRACWHSTRAVPHRRDRHPAGRRGVCLLGDRQQPTQSLTVRDPRSIVRIKGWRRRTVNTALALALGEPLPKATVLLAVLVLGASATDSACTSMPSRCERWARREKPRCCVAPFAGALLAPLVLPESFAGESDGGVAMATA